MDAGGQRYIRATALVRAAPGRYTSAADCIWGAVRPDPGTGRRTRMLGAFFRPLFRRGWRRTALFGVGVVAVAGSVWFGRGLVHRADAQPPAASVLAPTSTPAPSSDYASRVVAYIHQS